MSVRNNTDDFGEKTTRFESFLKSKCVSISPKVAIADFRDANQGRGLIALEDIEEGESLLEIPPSAMLRVDQDEKLCELVSEYELDSWSALIIRMMAAQSTEEWKPYFDVLPTEFNTPMFWPAEETAKLLKGSAVVEKIGRKEADESYDELAKGILKDKYFAGVPDTSREAFHRMGSLIMSYAFDVAASNSDSGHIEEKEDEDEEDEEEDVKAMVPLADILNSHTKLQNAQLTIPEIKEGNFEMVASKNIHKGQQIYNIYGNQPSSDMLRRYGFVEAGGTSYEVVELDLSSLIKSAQSALSLSKKDVETRLDALADKIEEVPTSFEIGLTVEEDGEDATPEVEFEPELLITVNALTQKNMKRKQFKEIITLVEEEQGLYPEAKQILRDAVKARREQYGKLREAPVPKNEEARVLLDKEDMCAQVRISELRVLDMALDWLTEEAANEPQPKKRKND